MIRLEKDGVRWEVVPDFAPLLDDVLKSAGERVKESRAKIVTRHAVGARIFYVKRYRHDAVPFRPLKFLFKRSQAREEWDLAQQLEGRNVPIVSHLALGERWSKTGLRESILVTAGFGGLPLNEVQGVDPAAVLKFVQQLHERGVLHEDLHAANLLVRPNPLELRLVDLHGARIKEAITAQERAENLALLRVSFPIPVPPEVQQTSAQTRRRLLFRRSKRCSRRNREFEIERAGGLKWHVRLPFRSETVRRIMQDPDAFLDRRAQILKPGRTSTVGRAEGVVLKRFNLRKVSSLLKDLGRRSRAKRSYRQAYHLELVGIPTARSIATADRRICGFLRRSYLLMEEIRGATDLGTILRTGARPQPCLIDQVATLVARLHDEGFSHRDLKETNLVLDDRGVLHVLDLDGLKFRERITERRAALDLLRLSRGVQAYPGVTRGQRLRFLRTYCRLRGLRRIPRLNCPPINRAAMSSGGLRGYGSASAERTRRRQGRC